MNAPLAERIRPKHLEDYISQQHLVGENGILTNHIKQGIIPSLILWGPSWNWENHTSKYYSYGIKKALLYPECH